MRITHLGLCVTVAVFIASPAAAQTTDHSPLSSPSAAPAGINLNGPSFKGLFADTAKDFKKLATVDAAKWLTIGGGAALVASAQDSQVTAMFAHPQLKRTFGQGALIGSAPFQMGAALTTFTIGRFSGNHRAAQVGSELFRAQTVAQLTTYAIKYTTRRTRPDGTGFSFPSGHTSVTVASATVLQRNFGWKVGIPAYGVAAYVAGSRLQTRRHHMSDVAFGAALGILAGRSVTIGHGAARMAVSPAAMPGGGGVTFTMVGRQ